MTAAKVAQRTPEDHRDLGPLNPCGDFESCRICTPWIANEDAEVYAMCATPSGPIVEDGEIICVCGDPQAPASNQAKANAAFIVRACNSHDDLVAALQAYVKSYGHIKPSSLLSQAEAALAKAEGQS